jgi:hypothetical protein
MVGGGDTPNMRVFIPKNWSILYGLQIGRVGCARRNKAYQLLEEIRRLALHLAY